MTAEPDESGSKPDSGGDTDGYVHRPSGEPRTVQSGSQDGFGWRGWVLVGAIVVVLLVIPGFILFLPQAQDLIRSFGLTLRDAYLVLPLVPAFVLGTLAVWAAVRARGET